MAEAVQCKEDEEQILRDLGGLCGKKPMTMKMTDKKQDSV